MRSARWGWPPTRSWWRGVTGRLSLSLEARALSDEAGGPADEELGDAAVFLPISVANPIIVSKESVEGDNCTSEMLDSDMFRPLVASTEGSVCLFWPQPQPCACFYSLEVLSPEAQNQPWLPPLDAFYSV